MNAALVALHAGNPCGEDRLILPEVEMLPLTLDPVVDRAVRRIALRARQTAAILLKGDDQLESTRLSGLAIETAILHNPRAVQRKGFGKKFVRVHP
jgi:hypothetical protein